MNISIDSLAKRRATTEQSPAKNGTTEESEMNLSDLRRMPQDTGDSRNKTWLQTSVTDNRYKLQSAHKNKVECFSCSIKVRHLSPTSKLLKRGQASVESNQRQIVSESSTTPKD